LLARQLRKPGGWYGWRLGQRMARHHQPLYDWTLPMLPIASESRVLDIGCGSGVSTRLLAERACAGLVVGLDYASTMVQQARQTNAAAIRAGRVAMVQGSVAVLPFAGALFDVACAIETFYFWPQPLACLRDLRRALKPGGTLAITLELSKAAADQQSARAEAQTFGVPLYSGAELESMLQAAGFAHTSHTAIPERGDGWLCALGTLPQEPWY
jgi:ubiquinone/menaquinone biosynthesis C-methylase UbiE